MKIAVLIPSLNPDEKLINYVQKLIETGFEKIIIVNDGSNSDYDKIFNQLKEYPECIVLKHDINQGKGRALKTGFNYYLNTLTDYQGLVTADSDGQHSPEDTMKVAQNLLENNNCLILGSRDFKGKDVPFKSRNGNKITTSVFKMLYGKYIGDTQTGLRGLTNNQVSFCTTINGERFEYETNMLIACVKNKVEIKEIPIDTIYLNNNETSHFNPIKDSIKIYKAMFSEFLRFTFSGITSFIIDILIFSILANIFFINIDAVSSIIMATIFARIISSLINFFLNKTVVFNSKQSKRKLIIKYYILCIIQMLSSALLVSILFTLTPLSKVVCKIIIDSILFLVSYRIQSHYIFKK
ncbi:MAG: bifunctional glycosyltransferase family 2/GtrA family protein [Bacilli bacterium]|nr:bifunctional glycosyltransferase family 2/GtrA family protein [Bacilli bacterium]